MCFVQLFSLSQTKLQNLSEPHVVPQVGLVGPLSMRQGYINSADFIALEYLKNPLSTYVANIQIRIQMPPLDHPHEYFQISFWSEIKKTQWGGETLFS